jgi:hypothetical protein
MLLSLRRVVLDVTVYWESCFGFYCPLAELFWMLLSLSRVVLDFTVS